MSSFLKKFLLGVIPATVALAANTQISTEKPVINFRLPLFNNEGYRVWMIRGSEGRYESADRIAVKELTLSVFSGRADEKVDTLVLSPIAVVNRPESVVTGPSTIRVINDQLEASGIDWKYTQIGKKNFKVSIAKNVRVVFQVEFKDLLQ
ncbi:MAG TPA: hypothetical protein VF388_03420 [Lacunisphaera sp.]